MSKTGACMSITSILGVLCFSSAGYAENFLEMIFGHAQQLLESDKNFAHPWRRNGHFSSASDHFGAGQRRRSHASRKLSDHGANAQADDSTPSPATMKLSYAEVWGAEAGGSEKCCTSAQDMITKVTRGDSTLRRGDAFMTTDGLQVFVGDRKSDPKFVPVEDAIQISPALKARLNALVKSPAMKPTRVAPEKTRVDSASASAAKAANPEKPPTQGAKDRLIKTPNGKTIRLVGGYAG